MSWEILVVSLVSPTVLAIIAGFILLHTQKGERLARMDERQAEATQKTLDRQADWDRQDAMAARVAQVATDAHDVVIATGQKLDSLEAGQKQIHELVNSNLTSSMQDSHDATVLLLAALEENVADKMSQHKDPNTATVMAIVKAKAKIAELAAQLADRAKAQNKVNKQQKQQEDKPHPPQP